MDLHVMLTTELQHFQVTAACHYNYEYSNIFPAVSTAFANHCSKAGVFVLSMWNILRRALLTFSSRDIQRDPRYLRSQLLLRISCLSAPVKFPVK